MGTGKLRGTCAGCHADAGLHVLKRSAWLLERPFHGFLKSLVERQARWAPEGTRIGHIDLGVEIETSEGERTCRGSKSTSCA